MLLLQETKWIFDLFGLLYEVIELPMLYQHAIFPNFQKIKNIMIRGGVRHWAVRQ